MNAVNHNIATFFTITAVCVVIIVIFVPTPLVISQVPDTSNYGVKISYPTDDQIISVGELTIFGTAKYNATITDCVVYADWNDLKPTQKVMPAGPNYTELGRTDDDYSTWIFSYNEKYHVISEGTNELTAKLSCDIGPFNSTKYDSVNVIGMR
ncbi:hypothetical protein BH18THE2_BH18THE2_06600 [soil metagenome]